MSILTRFEEVMSAEINAILDEAEDPSKMLDQYLRNIKNDLESIKIEIATLTAEEKRIQRIIEQHNIEIQSLEEYAAKALQTNSEDDARVFITKKTMMANELPNLEQQYNNATINTQNIKKMYDKLTSDFAELESNAPILKAKFSQAKLQNSMKQMTEGTTSEDRANAMLELNKVADDTTVDLKNKYDTNDINNQVEDELAKLKQKLNENQEQTTNI